MRPEPRRVFRFTRKRKTIISIAAICGALLWGSRLFLELQNGNLLSPKTDLSVDYFAQYGGADLKSNPLPSRQWMALAIQVVKRERWSPPAAARLFAYAASVYADALTQTDDPAQAGWATAEILKLLAPSWRPDLRPFGLSLPRIARDPTPRAQAIVDAYSRRAKEDGFDRAQELPQPSDPERWSPLGEEKDGAKAAGLWNTWILDPTAEFLLPAPPQPGSFWDRVELLKVRYAAQHRTLSQIPAIFLWQGTYGMPVEERRSLPTNASPAGTWLNILAMEKSDASDREFAASQKLLAQTLADALIQTWKIKYTHQTRRPFMRIPGLESVVADPPFPGYVSEYASASGAAATILTQLYPHQKSVWEKNAEDAAHSRLVAGVQFDYDNENGLALGNQIGRTIVKKLFGEESANLPRYEMMRPSPFETFRQWTTFTLQLWAQHLARSIKARPGDPLFQNVIASRKIKKGGNSRGISWHDIDRDGKIDLALWGGKTPGQVKLYRNTPDGFVDITDASGLNSLSGSPPISGIFGDYDNDGCPDLYVTRGRSSDRLFRGNCDGSFKDISEIAGISDAYQSLGAAWADYDRDGNLDIYVANFGETATKDGYVSDPNLLWRNNGDGTFSEIAGAAGVQGESRCAPSGSSKESFQPLWVDYNNDQWPDLFVATDTGVSPLYRNNGNGTFTEVTAEAGMCRIGTGMGATAGDYDEDGDLDIYVTNTGPNFLWRNNGDGTFTEIAAEIGVADPPNVGWGTEFFDLENDGDLDLFVANGGLPLPKSIFDREESSVWLDRLFENLGDGRFREVSEAQGIVGSDEKQAMATADYDGNGTLDLFIMSSFTEEIPRHRLYANRGRGLHWIRLELTGIKSNRDAVGTRIVLRAGGRTQLREIVSGSSYASQSALGAHFGLGGTRVVDRVEIRWPSGTVQVLQDLKADQVVKIAEPLP